MIVFPSYTWHKVDKVTSVRKTLSRLKCETTMVLTNILY